MTEHQLDPSIAAIISSGISAIATVIVGALAILPRKSRRRDDDDDDQEDDQR